MKCLYGTLALDTGENFDIYLNQTKNCNTWILENRTDAYEHIAEEPVTLTKMDLQTSNIKRLTKADDNPIDVEFDSLEIDTQQDNIVAVLKVHAVTNRIEGCGDTALLGGLINIYSDMVTKAIKSADVTESHLSCEYSSEYDDSSISVERDNGSFTSITMKAFGYRLYMTTIVNHKSLDLQYSPVLTQLNKNIIVANLGIKTATEAKLLYDLSWYEKDGVKLKNYKAIKTREEFMQMLHNFFSFVVKEKSKGRVTLVGLDTETTGLNMINLSNNNPLKDHIVAIPFAWCDDSSYVIFTDMEYFDNVDIELFKEYLEPVLSRPKDFSNRHISVTVEGVTYEFDRDDINVTGHNIIFDTKAFFVENIDVFFDDDTMQLGFNLATDWSKGKNSLKAWTRRLFGHNTLELEDLFGSAHKDKYKYLGDEELALIYGCADADYSRRVNMELVPLTEKNLYYQYRKYDIQLMHLYALAEANGMPIDTENVRLLGNRLKNDIESIKNFVYKYSYAAMKSKSNLKMKKIESGEAVDSDYLMNDLLKEVINAIEESGENEYRFRFVPEELKTILYDVLEYPVLKRSDKGAPCLDKYALKKLMSKQRDNPKDILKDDIPSEYLDEPLISAKDFNKDLYPLARVLTRYAELNKEYTAYYQPILEENMEGKMFKSFKTTAAATRRIINPLQTAKKKLKKYYIAPKGKIFCSFDASQIEYRHMASIAYIRVKKKLQNDYPDNWEEHLKETSIYRIVNMMKNPENDYHIETAAMLNDIPPYRVTPSQRKDAKTIGFGLPYGLGTRSLCDSRYGEINDETLGKTISLVSNYKEKQKEIIDMLEEARDEAFYPYPISSKFRHILDLDDNPDNKNNKIPEHVEVSVVRNFAGFYRLFFLKNLTRRETSSIRRKAGNCKIQGGAAELFRRMQYNFYMGCVKAGISDKIQWLVNVHDELDFLVDDDIDILKLIEVLYSSCTLRYKDHIPYYIGINFGYNWKDAKDDAAELPVIMVQRLIKAYHEHGFRIPDDVDKPKELLKLKQQYLSDRIGEVLLELQPDFRTTRILDTEYLEKNFTNYTVRSYLGNFLNKKVSNKYAEKKLEVPLYELIKCWLISRYGKDACGIKLIVNKKDNIIETITLTDVEYLKNASEEKVDDNLIEFMSLDVDDLLDSNDSDTEVYFGEEAFTDGGNITTGSFDEQATYEYEHEEDPDYDIDMSSKTAFDIYKPKRYMRKYILTSGKDVYSILLSNAPKSVTEEKLIKYIVKVATQGSASLTIIGKKTHIINNVALTENVLDDIDRYIGGIA